jgi:type IV secretion system protein VirD4
LLFQSVGQLEGQWGRDGKRAWYEGTSWRGYAAVQDDVTAEEISKACGTVGVIAYSESDNRGRQKNQNTFLSSSRSSGTTQNIQEIGRRLILPAEVTEMRSDDMIVFIPGRKPLRCGRPIYFRRKDMRAQVNDSRFRRE